MKQLLRLRKLLYKIGILSPVRLPALVISVGNISLGGTGKSPLVAHLADWLVNDLKKRVLLLSRGYGRRSKIPMYVPANSELPSSHLIGDEPWMVRNRVPGLSLLVHRNRAQQAEDTWDKLASPEVILMDDAFQHWKAERDVDIVAVDASEGIDMPIIPFGRLREAAESLARADIVIVTRANEIPPDHLESLLGRLRSLTQTKESANWKSNRCENKAILILQVDYELSGIYLENEDIVTDSIRKSPIVLLSGIAKPQSFRRLLEREGLQIFHHITLSDHGYPDDRDLVNLKKIIASNPGARLITTEKDIARLAAVFREHKLEALCAKVRFRFRGDGEARLHHFIQELI